MTSIEKAQKVRERRMLAKLANDQAYVKLLRPKLLKIKSDLVESIKEADTEFDAVKANIKLIQTNKVIKNIMTFIEGAEKKINQSYGRKKI